MAGAGRGALAVWAVVRPPVVPGVRWSLRRRVNRAIDELNTRLKLRIQPFKLAKRQALIEQLVFDPEVLHAVEDYAKANSVPREVAQDSARSATPARSCRPSAPTPISASARGSRGGFRPCSIACASAPSTTTRCRR